MIRTSVTASSHGVRKSDLEESEVWTQHRRQIWLQRGEFPRAHAVYFFEREGFCKIGRTADVTARARSVSMGSSMPAGMTVGPVCVLAVVYCNCPSECVRE